MRLGWVRASEPPRGGRARIGDNDRMNFDLDAVRRAALTHGYEKALRPALFRIGGGDAEAAHHATITAMAQLGSLPGNGLAVDALGAALGGPSSPVTLAGIRFPGRVGLAAGVDKDGVAVTSWQALGFGHVEVGTVTAHAQPGNPTPRLFRLKASHGLINRMGFNNDGSQALAATLRRARSSGNLSIPVGVSLGKTKTTPVEEATRDYLTSLGRLSGLTDYFAVNVSSPNTPGLRSLQDKAPLLELLQAITTREAHLAAQRGTRATPVFVKIAPDLTEDALEDMAGAAAGLSAFLLAFAVVLVWGITGPLFHYSDTWQLVINTGTTIVTFLKVFLIQNTQNRDTLALQVKLSELIIAMKGADNKLATIEDASDEELHREHEKFISKAK